MVKCSNPACPLPMNELYKDALKIFRVNQRDQPRYLPVYFCSPECAIHWLRDTVTEFELSEVDEKLGGKKPDGLYG